MYVVYNFIHDIQTMGEEDINIYKDYDNAKNEYDRLKKLFKIKHNQDYNKSFIMEGDDWIRFDDHEYSVKIGIRKLSIN